MRSFLVSLLVVAAFPLHVQARGSATTFLWAPTDRGEEERAIRALVEDATSAWNAGDAAAYAARFAADATFTSITGVSSSGHRAFEAFHEKLLKTIYRGSRLKQTIREIRFVSKDVAVVDIDTELVNFAAVPAGVKPWPDGVLRTRLQQVLVKVVNAWWITGYHDVDAKVSDSPS